MRVLVTGDRNWKDEQPVDWLLYGIFDQEHSSNSPLVVIEGGARGADACAATWCAGFGTEYPTVRHEQYPANWDDHGKAAGPIRNQQMLTEGKPDVVLAFHDDLASSKGTADIVRRAKRAGIPVYLVSRP